MTVTQGQKTFDSAIGPVTMAAPAVLKTCNICRQAKPVTEFYKGGKRKGGSINYKQPCKECYIKKYYQPPDSDRRSTKPLELKQLPEAVRAMAESQYELEQVKNHYDAKISRLKNLKNETTKQIIARIKFVRYLIHITLKKKKKELKQKKWLFRYGSIYYDGRELTIKLKTALAGECRGKP